MKNLKAVRMSVQFLRIMVGIMFLLVVCLTLLQVFCRFILSSPLTWSEELARFILIWMTMLGAPVLCYENSHLAITEFVGLMKPKGQAAARILMNCIVVALFALIVYVSPQLVRASAHIESGALKISFAYWRVSAAVGCFLMAFYTICNMLEDAGIIMGKGGDPV